MFVITKAFKLATPGLGGNWQRDSRALCGKTERGENCVYKHIKSQRSGSNNKQGNLFEIHYTLHGKGGGGGAVSWGMMMLQTVCVQK